MPKIKKFIIVIPFFKNEKYIDFFIDWYEANTSEHKLIDQIIIINDCPLNTSEYLFKKCKENNFKYILNEKNIGFIGSANIGFNIAKSKNKHLILLNSDTFPYGNFLSEFDSCFALDSNLGIIAPRSNNATICNLYNQPRYIKNKNLINKFISDFLKFKKITPKISYAPVVVGFCFCIRNDLLKIFGEFDPIFNFGYEEENDYCLRASKRGIRIGIANHAFVAHFEGRSYTNFKDRDRIKLKNSKILLKKYPYYPKLLLQYSSSINYKIIQKISYSLDNDEDILIDATNLSAYFNGTNKLICRFIIALNKLGYRIDIIANQAAIKFHKLYRLSRLKILNKPVKIYKTGIRIGQPFSFSDLNRVPVHSIFSTCIFLDTITDDCSQLSSEIPDLKNIWSMMPHFFTNISFISSYSKDQFVKKFGNDSSRLQVALQPLYTKPVIRKSLHLTESMKEIVLIIGNNFNHKAIDIALRELPVISNRTYFVIGEDFETQREDVKFFSPGYISEDEMASLMIAAKFVIFPTLSEGFGFPIIEALQYKKHIYCRALPPFIEIYNSINHRLQKFIKFVPDFRLDGNFIDVKIKKNSKVFFNNYVDYASHILQATYNISVEELHEQYRMQFFFKNPDSNSDGNILDLLIYPLNKFIRRVLPSIHKKIKKKALRLGLNAPKSRVTINLEK